MGESIISNSEDPLSSKLKTKIKEKGGRNLILILIIIMLIFGNCFFLDKQGIISIAQANFEKDELSEIENKKEEEVEILSEQEIAKKQFEKELYEMVAGYPIEEMVPYIAEYDREIAALIIGIGKKESNWGKRSPVKPNGDTCYNYWGYKGAGSEGIAMGHGCFGSPKEAVDAIGGRIKDLSDQGLNTPSEMIVWKCGRSCAGHAPGSPEKWISDVNIYYSQIMKI